ncbi:hypothetical protein GCM10023264_04540 [Sphingomonas daechungensis]|uniref:Uncharacterized protein n=1 Tax=Sphingomonas daechungensis TaxID=1176646 RepID=A0ABX6T1G4_9SPHN|nr:hypothetical protein [Sphingomonas daechungensis]QNP42855.1 hypothetical protein H9L15_12415 [Sphingomonas daechungensis]
MGAPAPAMKAAEDSSAEVLLSKLESVTAAERRRHATVYNYWLSIRGDRHFPPIRDLDPLEISDAGPSSLLLELIGGGEDAEIRHLGQSLKDGPKIESISQAASPSLLACIAKQLPAVASARQAIAFEDEFVSEAGTTRCGVTLLPFSSTGTYVDYVYGFVSLAAGDAKVEESSTPEEVVEREPSEEPVQAEPVIEDEVAEVAPEPVEDEPVQVEAELVEEPEAIADVEEHSPEYEEASSESEYDEPAPDPVSEKRPGFAKIFDAIAGVGNFYGNVVQMDSKLPTEPVREAEPEVVSEVEPEEALTEAEDHVEPEELPVEAEGYVEELEAEPEPQAASVEETEPEPEVSNSVPEGFMQTRLSEVRSKADEARAAKLRANAALYEGLSAAYDFALDAEENAEEYLKLVEAQGLKIQLRSPMKPVVKLAFDGLCDEATISQLESVLAWALKHDLPRGSLAERIEAEGGLGAILSAKAA